MSKFLLHSAFLIAEEAQILEEEIEKEERAFSRRCSFDFAPAPANFRL